jgi:hypothetical protein
MPDPDLHTLFAKIQALPKRRIAEIEDFVDFLALRRAGKPAKPPLDLEEEMQLVDDANQARHGRPPV